MTKNNKLNLKKYFSSNSEFLHLGDTLEFLNTIESKTAALNLVVTSPPYNIGKEYESAKTLDEYFENQQKVIKAIDKHVKDSGSICWQVGNYINKKEILITDLTKKKYLIIEN